MFTRLTYRDLLREERLREHNDCHNPAGPGGGQFCAKGGGAAGGSEEATVRAALEDYDRRHLRRHLRNPRVYYNPFAGKLYAEQVDKMMAAMQQGKGVSIDTAVQHFFEEPLTSHIQKALTKARTPKPPSSRVTIKPSAYRDKPGFTIRGTTPTGQRVSVFAKTRTAAEHIKRKIKRGERIEVADFDQ